MMDSHIGEVYHNLLETASLLCSVEAKIDLIFLDQQ